MKYIDKLDCSIKINLLSTRLRRHLTYLLALCCLSLPASAVSLPSEKLHFDIRSASLNFTKVAGHKGLDLSNMAVISDDNGYLWVGTQDGLMRLDGYQSKRYTASARKKNALVSNFINSLAYNRQTKEIWIATTGGLSVFNLKKETFKSYLYDPRVANGIPHNMVQTVLVDSRQRVWIGTKNGLSRYIPESDSFDSFWSKEEQSESNSKGIKNNTGLPHSNILAINEDHQGAIWIATQRGLARYIGNGEFQSFLPFTNDDGSGGLITKMAIDRQNNLWLGSEQKGLFYFEPEIKRTTQYQTAADGKSLPSNSIRSIMIEDSGDVWVGTGAGLAIFKADEERFLTITNNSDLNGNIVSLYQDSNEVVWIGTWSKGLHNFNPRETQIGRIDLRTLKTTDNVIKSIIAGQGDDFWVANPKSLYKINSKKGSILKYDIKPINPLSSRAIPFIDRRTSSLYLLTDKIHQFNNTQQVISFELPEELRNVSWYGVTVDRYGRLWMAARNLGLYVLSADFTKVVHHQAMSTAGYVRQVDENTILAGSLSGTYWININTFQAKVHTSEATKGMLHSNVTGYHLSSENMRWLATSGGIHRLYGDEVGSQNENESEPETGNENENDYYQSWNQEHGLPTDVLTGPLEDSLGKLWFGSTDGLIRFDPRNESIEHFDGSLGALSNYYIGQYLTDTDKRLIFQGPSGISIIDEQLIRSNDTQYKVVLDAFWLKDQSQDINNEAHSGLEQAIQFTDSITLPANNRDFSFAFTTTYMTRADKVNYFYRLAGFDNKWLAADSQNRLLKYTNLDPGNYRFEIYAMSPTGVKGEVRSVSLTLLPLVYETVWFRTLVVGFILLSILIWYKLRMRSIKRYNQELEAQIQQRTKAIRTLTDIAKDISSILNIEQLIAHLHGHLINSLDLSVLALGVLENTKNRLRFESCLENGKTIPLHYREVDSLNDLAGWCVTNRKEIRLKTYSDRFEFLQKSDKPVVGEKMQTVIYLPMRSRSDQMIGCLTVQSDKVDAFSDEDIEFIRTITNYTEVALDNALAHQELKRVSSTDYLTNLPNRRSFTDSACYLQKVANRSDTMVALAMADIDHFKQFNDQYGHDCGDFVLQQVAGLFRSLLREQDIVARWGGEEFIFLFPNTPIEGAVVALEKLRYALESENFVYEDKQLSISATFGVTTFEKKEQLDDVIDQADLALYQGKNAGRNRVQVFEGRHE
jgi:diguanylate cyclase (GGDEF)-like protein